MFFAPLPEPDEHDHGSYEAPEWLQPPWGVLPGLVPVTRVLARSPHAAVVLRAVEAYPQGVRFALRSLITRDGLDRRAWRQLVEDVMGHGVDASPSDVLRLGVSYADGTRVVAGSVWPMPEGTPDAPVLTLQGGGGGGSGDHYEVSNDAWLWPFPPPGPLTLHFSWTALGIPEGSIELDASAFLTARADAQTLWP